MSEVSLQIPVSSMVKNLHLFFGQVKDGKVGGKKFCLPAFKQMETAESVPAI